MDIVDVPGAKLYYDIRGSGPLLLLIPGASGDARPFTALAEHLTAHFTVVTYDRRGFSRSSLDGPQDYSRRLDTDADDARRLIEHTGHRTAIVFGTSSGALIALHLLTRHPEAVGHLVPYEPPALRLLHDGQHWIDFFHQIYDLYRSSGIAPAMTLFRERTFVASDGYAMARAMDLSNPRVRANATYWFEHELRQYPAIAFDLDTLKRHAGQVIPAAGHQSQGRPCYRATAELGALLDRKLIELPGGHVGFATHPTEFADRLREFLEHHAP
ncbi:alpha/beta hydrolase [Actinoallomurus vinaceus]|uniref:Alpha/beta hydrolase n=1 Tax=Actinoallomurus vinaceus TaxID=1080074 RepID=A0ABP8U4V6_9ACTN